MKVSIIIPCYNEERTIEKILEKIFNLRDINLEIIVIDDGSTDLSKDILEKKLKNKIDKLILNKKNWQRLFY